MNMSRFFRRIYHLTSVLVVFVMIAQPVSVAAASLQQRRSANPPEIQQATSSIEKAGENAPGEAGGYTLYLPLVMQDYTAPAPVEAVITPAEGGTLTSDDGTMTVHFDAGVITQTASAIYQERSPIAPPPGKTLVGTPFALTLKGSDGTYITDLPPLVSTEIISGMETYTVTPRVHITLSYDEASLGNADESRLRLHYRDSHGDWIPMLTLVDAAANQVSVPADHFTEFALLAPAAVPTDTLVVIDPDHGGSDPGGTVTSPAEYALEEKVINLQVGMAVRDYLQACGVNVEMTRADDSSVSPVDRATFINALHPDLAVSIGTNIITHDMAHFIGGPLGLADFSKPDDIGLAQQFVDSIADVTGLPADRGVKDARTWRGGLYVPTHVPGVFYAHIETAYMDSYHDRDNVIDPHLDYIAGGIYNGIITALDLTASCPPFSDTMTNPRRERTLGINHWTRYTAQGVNPVTGNQFQWARDLFVPGTGLNIDIVRYYNSQSDDVGLFGRGWASIYDMRVTLLSDGTADVKYADGHHARFTPDGSGGYQPDAGVFDTLENIGGGYRLTTPNQIRFVFDSAGVLQSIQDEDGNAITLHYNGALLDWIEDTVGRRFEVDTNAGGQITRIEDPSGREVTYQYGLVSLQYTRYLEDLRAAPLAPQDANQLLSMTDARGGNPTTYEYDPAGGYLQGITDPEGMTYLENVYTPDGRVASQQDGNKGQGSWDYDIPNMRATFTDNEGNQTIYIFDDQYRVIEERDALGQSTYYEYDDNDNIITMTDKRGNTWHYTYDARGNMLTRTDPLDQWSLYDSDVTTWTYDDKNNPTSMTDALGNTWTYQYDEKGNPVKIIEPNGAVTEARYDDKGQMIWLKDAERRETTFDYDAHGNLIKTWNAIGGWTESTYDDAGHQLTMTDCLNPPLCTETRTTTFEYDGNGNITRQIDPMGEATTFEYDGNNMLTRKVDRRGGVWEYRYDDNLNPTWEKDPLGRITEYTYDKMNHRLTAKDPLGRITRFEYDDIYRLVKVTNPKGDEYHYTYDPNGNLLTLTDPLNQVTRFVYDVTNRRKYVYDAIGGTTEYCYDPLDRIVRVFDPRRAVTDIRYDSVGNMVEIVDPLGNRTTFGFDLVHNRTRLTEGIPSDGGEADGRTTIFKYDALNREIRRTDPLGRATETQYDGVGNVRFITDPMNHTTEYRYNLNGWVTETIDPLGYRTTSQYDEEGAIRFFTDANTHTTEYQYDLAGQLRFVIDPLNNTTEYRYDAAGNQRFVIDANGETWEYVYDALNLLTDEYDPLHNHTRYEYDALRRMVSRTDANGVTTTYTYNPLGWLTGVTDAENGTTRYEYDAVGNRTAIIDANGVTTTFEYNFLNQLTREINPLGDTWEYSYDPSGNMIRRVDGKWQATYYRYDAASQLIATIYGEGQGGNYTVTFEYDDNGNQTAMHDWNGDWTYTYDALNRRTGATDYNGRTLTWEYDPAGNLIGMTFPDGRHVAYTYDANDRLDTLTDAQGRSVTWDYNPLGYVTGQTNPNGTQATYDYDAAGRLTYLGNTGPAGVIAAYNYTLDAVGNRTQTIEHRGAAAVTRNYTYDDLYRLTRAQTDTGQDMTYIYDPVGNRTQKVGVPEPVDGSPVLPEDTVYTYNDLNAMLTAGDTDFDYDANGNRIRKTEPLTATAYISVALSLGWEITGTVVTDYAWDYSNHLTAVSTAIHYTDALSGTEGVSTTMQARYIYDGIGRRVEKWVTTTITATGVLTAPAVFHREYVFDGLDPAAEYDYADGATLTPTLTAHYTYGNGRIVLMERTPAGGPVESYWYHYDGLGSVVALTDESGAETCQWKYDEYGNPLRDCPDLNHYTYTGQEYDPETGLTHFFARYYDVGVGVWVSQDTHRGHIANPMTVQRYAYVINNPIIWVDQYGYSLGEFIGAMVGRSIGGAIGTVVGGVVGASIGFARGGIAGVYIGAKKGMEIGNGIGTYIGAYIGDIEGAKVGSSIEKNDRHNAPKQGEHHENHSATKTNPELGNSERKQALKKAIEKQTNDKDVRSLMLAVASRESGGTFSNAPSDLALGRKVPDCTKSPNDPACHGLFQVTPGSGRNRYWDKGKKKLNGLYTNTAKGIEYITQDAFKIFNEYLKASNNDPIQAIWKYNGGYYPYCTYEREQGDAKYLEHLAQELEKTIPKEFPEYANPNLVQRLRDYQQEIDANRPQNKDKCTSNPW